MRSHFFEIEAANPPYPRDEGSQFKANPYPITPLLLGDLHSLIIHFDPNDGMAGIDKDAEIQRGRRRILSEIVPRPNQLGLNDLLFDAHGVHGASGYALVLLGHVSVEGKCSISSLKVRSPHPGKLDSRTFHRWEIGRNADDGCLDSAIPQDLPERPSLAQQRDLARRKRKDPVSKMDHSFGGLSSRRREVELHRGWISMNKVKNLVPSWIHSGNERRPGHRTLRRHRGCQ